MIHSFKNPTQLHSSVQWAYSQTAQIPQDARLIFIAGQTATNADAQVQGESFGEQVVHAFLNLRTALEAHGADFKNVVRLSTYIVGVDFKRLGTLTSEIQKHWPTEPPTQTLLGVSSLAMPNMLFEVDAIAAISAS